MLQREKIRISKFFCLPFAGYCNFVSQNRNWVWTRRPQIAVDRRDFGKLTVSLRFCIIAGPLGICDSHADWGDCIKLQLTLIDCTIIAADTRRHTLTFPHIKISLSACNCVTSDLDYTHRIELVAPLSIISIKKLSSSLPQRAASTSSHFARDEAAPKGWCCCCAFGVAGWRCYLCMLLLLDRHGQ